MLKQLLIEALEINASDVHLTVGLPPVLRVDGHLVYMKKSALDELQLRRLAEEIIGTDRLEHLHGNGELDISYEYPSLGSFRINIYHQRGMIGIALRIIRTKMPTLAELGIPDAVATLTRRKNGLILMTGPAGSGKSTTLAAMTDLINSEKEYHIITLEDPIEYIHHNKKSMVTQREIGRDSRSYPTALRAALRQDPDVILVGEMRDIETISIAVTAAETGHLVMATLHTINSAQTVERIINGFPSNQQEQIRIQLANSLAGVISQRLIRCKNGKGRIPAVEIMICTPAIRSLIREGKVHQINSFIQAGSRYGMQTMDKHLQNLREEGLISSQEALDYAIDRESMLKIIKPMSENV